MRRLLRDGDLTEIDRRVRGMFISNDDVSQIPVSIRLETCRQRQNTNVEGGLLSKPFFYIDKQPRKNALR